MDKLDIPKRDDEDQVSSSTLSYNAWNSKSLVNWQDFEEVTGPSHGRASPDGKESEPRKKKRTRMARTLMRKRTPMRSNLGM
jgi:hypothetical protein